MTEWEKIVADHGGSAWRTAWRLLGDHADAADCYQEAFVSALELSRRQPVHNWGGLLQRLATRKALDQLRGRRRRLGGWSEPADYSALASEGPGPGAIAAAAELSEGLRRALAELPADQAEAFSLRCFGELKYGEIARSMGLRTVVVGVLIHRARGRLRELLSSHQPCDVRKDAEVQA